MTKTTQMPNWSKKKISCITITIQEVQIHTSKKQPNKTRLKERSSNNHPWGHWQHRMEWESQSPLKHLQPWTLVWGLLVASWYKWLHLWPWLQPSVDHSSPSSNGTPRRTVRAARAQLGHGFSSLWFCCPPENFNIEHQNTSGFENCLNHNQITGATTSFRWLDNHTDTL